MLFTHLCACLDYRNFYFYCFLIFALLQTHWFNHLKRGLSLSLSLTHTHTHTHVRHTHTTQNTIPGDREQKPKLWKLRQETAFRISRPIQKVGDMWLLGRGVKGEYSLSFQSREKNRKWLKWKTNRTMSMLFNDLKANAKNTAKKWDEGGCFWGIGSSERKKMIQGAHNFHNKSCWIVVKSCAWSFDKSENKIKRALNLSRWSCILALLSCITQVFCLPLSESGPRIHLSLGFIPGFDGSSYNYFLRRKYVGDFKILRNCTSKTVSNLHWNLIVMSIVLEIGNHFPSEFLHCLLVSTVIEKSETILNFGLL